MSAFETTAGIARASFRVLGRHRRLLWFPMLSIATSLAVLVSFIPLVPELEGAKGGMLLCALYFGLELVGVFFAAAITCEALRALRQQSTSVAGGLGCAASRIGALSGYAAIEASVGVFLGALSRRQRPSLVRYLFGAGWQLVTFLAMPVLIAERRGGYQSLMRAGKLFRQTWGETTLSELGIRVVTANFVILVIAILVLLSRVFDESIAVILVLALVLGVGVILSALQTIYRAALYIYAAEGVVPDEFDTPEMHRVWKVR